MTFIQTADLFLPLQQELVTLLRSLAPADWSKPTVAGTWTVKDVVTHILDGDLRRLSIHRDGYFPPSPAGPPGNYAELVAMLNNLNATWVQATQRLSPRMLTDLLEWAGPQVAEFFLSLPPDGEAIFPVAWAGEDTSRNWMDIGRDFTEKWHHQAQVRDAVGVPLLLERKWLYPVLDLSLYALPYAFRGTTALTGHVLNVFITGDAGGEWHLLRRDASWQLGAGAQAGAQASVRLDSDTAWRLFYNALTPLEARKRIEAEGDPTLCEPFLTVRSVMV